MSLIELEAGTEARVQPLNDNFTYLETQITNVGNTVSSQASQISTLSTSVSTLNTSVSGINTTLTSKANTNGDNITEAFATKLVNSYGDKFESFPDYSSATSKTNGTLYTASKSGVVSVSGQGGASGIHVYIEIDGVRTNWAWINTNNFDRGFQLSAEVKAGHTYKAYSTHGASVNFYED